MKSLQRLGLAPKRTMSWIKCSRLVILLATGALSLIAQPYPSKEYVRLGSRVIAIESAPLVTLSNGATSETNASSVGETGKALTITGSPSSSWTATSTANWISIATGAGPTPTNGAGQGTITYNLATYLPSQGSSTRTGSILVQMESGTTAFSISQLCCSSAVLQLSRTSDTAPATGVTAGAVSISQISPSNLQWITSAQSCFSFVTPGGTGAQTITYTLPANNSTNQIACTFTVSAAGVSPITFTVTQAGVPGLSQAPPGPSLTVAGTTYTSTLTAGGTYTINALNWTGWTASITANSPLGWLSFAQLANTVQYTVPGTPGSATLSFSGGTPSTTFTLNVTESSGGTGGTCSASPTLSLSRTSMSFTGGGGSGQTGQDPTDYAVTITSNTNWTASCSNAGGEALSFYLGGGSTPGNCAAPLSGTSTQTLAVVLRANQSIPTVPLSSTLNVTTCGGSSAKSSNMTIAQAPATFTVLPSSQNIYQSYANSKIQFTAYVNGLTSLPAGQSVSWSLSDASGNSGIIDSTGLYTPPVCIPSCSFSSVNVRATLSAGGVVATAPITVLTNPYAPSASVASPGSSGPGGNFQFQFDTGNPADPPAVALIQNATMVFSSTALTQGGNPTLTGCWMYIAPGYGVYSSVLQLDGQSANFGASGGHWSPSYLANTNCSVNLKNTEQTMFSWATSGGANTSPLIANIPVQFYAAYAGAKGIWATSVENGNTTAGPFFLGTYTAVAPTLSVSPGSANLNVSGQTQQFTALASGATIPDVVWNAPSAGTINTAGLYTAPNPLTTAQSVSISGKRSSDNSAICCATVTLSPSSVTVNPSSVTLYAGQTQTITTTVNGSSNQSVTWNTPSAGTFSGGLYSAPAFIATQQTVTLTATSVADPTKTGSAVITLIPVGVSLSPTSASFQINQSQGFTPTVTGTSNQSLTWTLSPSGSSSGSVTGGLYTAPSTIPTGKTVTLTATSVADPTKSSSATLTLIADTLAIAPTSASLAQSQSQQFTASMTGTTNTSVNWSMSPSVGILSTGGYYTAPSSIASQQTVVVTATSQADALLSKSVNVVLNTPVTLTASAGTPQTVAINTSFPTALQVTVKNLSNNPVSGVTVTFTAPGTGASAGFSGSTTATAVTNSSGVATAPTLTASATAGSYTVTASAPGGTTTANFSLTNTPGGPASIAGTAGTPQSAIIGAPFAAALQATVKDAGNNPVSGVIVTFTAPTTGATAAFGGLASATATTNSGGVATAPTLNANTTAGSYTVTASVAGVATPASFSLTNNVGAPASITATAGTPQTATTNTAFATALQATVKDIGGNLVNGATVTFTAPATGASATFSGSTTATAATNSSGIATAPTLTANTTAGSYTVTASVSGVSASASFSLTNHAIVVVMLTSGTSWTAPTGVTSIQVECVGGGGGGASAYSSANGGGTQGVGGGGGGAYARRNAMAVTPGNAYAYAIGAGGAGGTGGLGGSVGGTTTFTGDSSVKCKAAGGNPGPGGSSGGSGGSTVTGDVTHNGGNGAAGSFSTGYGGGGGGSGGTSSTGNSGTTSTGGAAVTGGGPGGNGRTGSSGVGSTPSTRPGGGGGGALSLGPSEAGGAGASGQITITYTQ